MPKVKDLSMQLLKLLEIYTSSKDSLSLLSSDAIKKQNQSFFSSFLFFVASSFGLPATCGRPLIQADGNKNKRRQHWCGQCHNAIAVSIRLRFRLTAKLKHKSYLPTIALTSCVQVLVVLHLTAQKARLTKSERKTVNTRKVLWPVEFFYRDCSWYWGPAAVGSLPVSWSDCG